MATSTLVSLEEYLHTTYEPDCEYVDGELVERNVGEYYHSRLQAISITFFEIRSGELKITTFPEQRIRAVYTASRQRFRIPDVCVMRDPHRIESVLTEPPLIGIEILSPDDRMSRIMERVRDFQEMGIRHIWVADPYGRTLHVVDEAGKLRAVPDLKVRVPELNNLIVDFGDFFAILYREK